MRHRSESPYARALGDRIRDLHPELRRYFSAIPDGQVGIGEGVFDRFGTTRRWLSPFLRLLRRRGVLVPGMHRGVPFRVENRTIAGRAIAERTLQLPDGPWTMCDAVKVRNHGRVVDLLGEPWIVAASFDVDVDRGAVRMTSRATGLRIGRVRIRVPRALSPRVRLTERWDADASLQRVALTMDLPLVGRIYEYAGSFTYRLEGEA